MIARRALLARAASVSGVLALGCKPLSAAERGVFTPEMFGAKGDGVTDDSAAFATLGDRVSAVGGGTVEFRQTTYRVGGHQAMEGARLLEFIDCHRPVVVRGNGARLVSAPGRRYGMFEADGKPAHSPNPRRARGILARPYKWMILASGCTGGVEIRDLELDGNQGTMIVGGKRGDKGWQIASSGIALRNNPGPELIANVYVHHHAQDGFYIDGPEQPTPGVRRRLVGLRADMNGRQGMSIVGGQDYEISECSFTRTGRKHIRSAPSAGVDIEAQRGKRIRNLHFRNCTFSDNAGVGLVADSGPSADCHFSDCRFIGTSNWSCWPRKPGFVFENCLFVGSLVNPWGDKDPARATKFLNCRFSDDPKLSPTGRLTLRKSLIANIPRARNVLFDHCSFECDHEGVLPWSTGAIYRDCTMRQRVKQWAHTRGVFQGRNVIDGQVKIHSSAVEGTLVLNGKVVPPRPGGKKQ